MHTAAWTHDLSHKSDMTHVEDGKKHGHGYGQMQQYLRRLQVLQQHLSTVNPVDQELKLTPCRTPAWRSDAKHAEASKANSHSDTKVATASEAVALIPDSAVITVTHSRLALLGYLHRISLQACMCILACKLPRKHLRPCMSQACALV